MLFSRAATTLWCLSVCAIAIVGHANQMNNYNYNYSIGWHLQRVDHFSYSNNDMFKQRFVISTEHWKPNGPIFFYAGNEGDILVFANNTGFMWQNAKQFNAMVLFVEHRYYGESMPYGNKSFDGLEYKGYLTVGQALEDFAQFLTTLKDNNADAKDSPVIAFGGSYGGMLAAWFRMKYPHIVIGSLAASAPILQFPGIYRCNQYYEIATKSYENYSPLCSQSIRNSWKAIRRVAQNEDGLNWLSQQFALCNRLTKETLDTFIGWISTAWDSLAMIDYPNAADFLQPLPAYPIKVVCQSLTTPNADDRTLIKTIFNAVSVYYNYTGQSKCNQLNQNDRLGLSGWDFQACTEMVLPVCSDGVTDMFEKQPWNFTEFSNNCKKTNGVAADKIKALTEFGGKHIKSATNIIFSNGQRDPWSAGGVLETLSETLISIIIPGACHHEDLRESGPNDPQVLIDARKQEINIIKKWIADYYITKNIV